MTWSFSDPGRWGSTEIYLPANLRREETRERIEAHVKQLLAQTDEWPVVLGCPHRGRVGNASNAETSFGSHNVASIVGNNSGASAFLEGNNTATVVGNSSQATAEGLSNNTARVFGNNSTATAEQGTTAIANGDNQRVTKP